MLQVEVEIFVIATTLDELEANSLPKKPKSDSKKPWTGPDVYPIKLHDNHGVQNTCTQRGRPLCCTRIYLLPPAKSSAQLQLAVSVPKPA